MAGSESEGKELSVEEIRRRIKELDGKRLALEKWTQRYNGLKREVEDLQTIHDVYVGALLAQSGDAVNVGVQVWSRRDLEREVDKISVILRGKEKALKDWERRVERLRKEVEEGERFMKMLYNARMVIDGKVVSEDGENKA